MIAQADRHLRPRRRRAGARGRRRGDVGGRMRFVAQRRNGVACPTSTVDAQPARRRTTCRTRSRRSRSAARSACPTRAIAKALAEFNGVGRRFQRYGDVALAGGGTFTLIDDYGHHPVEMAATLAAARGAFPAGASCSRSSRTATRARATVRGLRPGAVDAPTRCCWPTSIRPARRRSSPPTAARWRARCASPARSSRCSSRRSPTMPQAIVDAARATATSSSRWARARSATCRRRCVELAGGERHERLPSTCKALGKVAVLMGGTSAEREISLMSGNGVLAALQSQGVDAHAVRPGRARAGRAASARASRAVFIALHGRYGEDGTVQGALELLRHSVHRPRRDGLGASRWTR